MSFEEKIMSSIGKKRLSLVERAITVSGHHKHIFLER